MQRLTDDPTRLAGRSAKNRAGNLNKAFRRCPWVWRNRGRQPRDLALQAEMALAGMGLEAVPIEYPDASAAGLACEGWIALAVGKSDE